MHSRLTRLIVSLHIFIFGTSAFAVWHSGGAEFSTDQNNIWNMGSEPIEYCVMVADDYPLSPFGARTMVHSSLIEWKNFFIKYNLDTERLPLPNVGNKSLTLNFREVARCDSPEQIRFAFGLDMSAIMGTNPHNRLGAAIRSDYDHQRFRNGGYVWIRNFTNRRNLIRHVLLHELGHVFGMVHNSVWVMSSRAGDFVRQMQTEAVFNEFPTLFGKIESSAWPFKIAVGSVLQPYKDFCGGPSDFVQQNHFLIPEVRNRFSGDGNDRHSLEIEIQNLTNGRLALDVNVTEDNGTSHSFPGQLLRMGPQAVAKKYPGIFTIWDMITPWFRMLTESTPGLWAPFSVPAYGSLNVGGANIPMIIELKGGRPRITLYSPEASAWQSIAEQCEYWW